MEAVENKKSFFQNRIVFTITVTLILGLIAHFYAMTHTFHTYDSLWNIYSNQNMISSGRQFLMFACGISSYYALSWINTLLAIIYIGFSVVLICDIFNIEDKLSIILISGLIVTFPSVTNTIVYSFTVDGYMLALFLSILAYYLSRKFRYGFIPAIFALGVSLGIYQAYFSVTILLCVIGLINDILNGDKFTTLFKQGGKYMAMGILSYIFYVITLNVMLRIENAALSGYQGSDKVGSLALLSIPSGLKAAFNSSYYFLRYPGVFTQNPAMKLAYFAFFCLIGYLIIRRLIMIRKNQLGFRIMSIIVLSAIVPFAISFIAILSPDAHYHLLMRMSMFTLFVFPFTMIGTIREKISFKLLSLFSFIMVFCFIISANIVYFNLNERYEKTYSLAIRIVDRLEQTDGYTTGDPVAILGGTYSQTNYPVTDITRDVLKGYQAVDGDYTTISSHYFKEFAKHYLGVTLETVDNDAEEYLVSTDEFYQMEAFPSDSSIRYIDGVWVVRIND